MLTSTAPTFVGLISNIFGRPDFMVILTQIMFILVFSAFPIWMVIDCITKESSLGNDKLVWLLVIVLVPLGSLVYFFARKLRRRASPPAM